MKTLKKIKIGEEKRMKKINERKEHYYESLKKLKIKCLTSYFNPNLVEDRFKKIN